MHACTYTHIHRQSQTHTQTHTGTHTFSSAQPDWGSEAGAAGLVKCMVSQQAADTLGGQEPATAGKWRHVKISRVIQKVGRETIWEPDSLGIKWFGMGMCNHGGRYKCGEVTEQSDRY